MTRRRLEDFLRSSDQNNFRLLRLIAAIMVVEGHSRILLYDPARESYEQGTFHFNSLGLPSFFFLSGLLVTQSLFQSSSWKNFIWKRILRVYPVVWFFLLLAALIMGPIVTTMPLAGYWQSPQLYRFIGSINLLHTDLMLPGVFTNSTLGTASVNSSLWTVTMELKLYLGLLLIGWIIKKFPAVAKWVLLLLILSAILINNRMAASIPTGLRPWFTFGVQFLSGVLCYLHKDKIIVPRYLCLLLPPLFLVSLWSHTYSYAAYVLVPATVIVFGTLYPKKISAISPVPDLSYGIYVFAFPVQQLIANYLHPGGHFSFFILSMALTLPFALFSWYAIEKNALRLKKAIG
jgi:peptidoglycan/LPS O-acetylase OafA/YrhL